MSEWKFLAITIFAVIFSCIQSGTAAAPPIARRPPPSPRPYRTLFDLMTSSPDYSIALGLFNHTGLIPLLKDPNTMITCFLPSSRGSTSLNDIIDSWDGQGSRGHYVWAILLGHCLDGQQAMTVSQLTAHLTYGEISNLDNESIRNGRYADFDSAINSYSPYESIRIEERDDNYYIRLSVGEEARIIACDLRGGKSFIHLLENWDQYPSFAPPDTYDTVLEYGEYITPFAWEVFSSSILADFLQDPERSSNITVLFPTDMAWPGFLSQLNLTTGQFLRQTVLVDLITAAHVINGSSLFTGAFISYSTPLTWRPMAGPALKSVGDLTIFPKRPVTGTAKTVLFSNTFTLNVAIEDYDIGGNERGDNPNYAAHMVNKVILPQSIRDLVKRIDRSQL